MHRQLKNNKYKQPQFSKKGSNVQNLRRCQRSQERGGFQQRFKHSQCLTVLRQLDSQSQSLIPSDPKSCFFWHSWEPLINRTGRSQRSTQIEAGGKAECRENMLKVTCGDSSLEVDSELKIGILDYLVVYFRFYLKLFCVLQCSYCYCELKPDKPQIRLCHVILKLAVLFYCKTNLLHFTKCLLQLNQGCGLLDSHEAQLCFFLFIYFFGSEITVNIFGCNNSFVFCGYIALFL